MQFELHQRDGGTAHLSPPGGQASTLVLSATAFDATDERR